jgi:hypothetical protein
MAGNEGKSFSIFTNMIWYSQPTAMWRDSVLRTAMSLPRNVWPWAYQVMKGLADKIIACLSQDGEADAVL